MFTNLTLAQRSATSLVFGVGCVIPTTLMPSGRLAGWYAVRTLQ